MIITSRKPTRKQALILAVGICPRCGHSLVYRQNSKTQERFIGCSNFPKCKYVKVKTIIDYACESLGVEWRPNIDNKAIDMFDNIIRRNLGSKNEVEYMLGAAYYLDHLINNYDHKNRIELFKTYIEYHGEMYDSIAFREPYKYWYGCTAPSAMAFVPQIGFGLKLHHDFGVFFSEDKSPTSSNWNFEFGVEIDIHPYHEANASMDKYRDSLVTYPVLRLHPNKCGPLVWFSKGMSLYSRKYERWDYS